MPSIREGLSKVVGWFKVKPEMRRTVKLIATVFLWLLIGTVFYSRAKYNSLGSMKGYYMAVNIGYSIGFGWPTEPYTPYLYFSTAYVIVGASFVALALGHFAEMVGEDYNNWFEKLLVYEDFKEAMKSGNFFQRAKAFLAYYEPQARAVGVWVVWIAIMITYSVSMNHGVDGWNFAQGLYFAVSTLSTGGHYPIPQDSPTWMFGVTAFMAMLGVPIMAVAMARIAQVMVEKDNAEAKINLLREPVTLKELEVCKDFGLEDGDGKIDRFEFIVLCTMRLGVDPNTCLFISRLFDELDNNGDGVLSIEEITREKFQFAENEVSTRHLPAMTKLMRDTKLVRQDALRLRTSQIPSTMSPSQQVQQQLSDDTDHIAVQESQPQVEDDKVRSMSKQMRQCSVGLNQFPCTALPGSNDAPAPNP